MKTTLNFIVMDRKDYGRWREWYDATIKYHDGGWYAYPVDNADMYGWFFFETEQDFRIWQKQQ